MLYLRRGSNSQSSDSYSEAFPLSYEGMLCVWQVTILRPLEPRSSTLPTELHTPCSTDKGYRTQWHPGYEPGPKTFSIGVLRKTLESNQIPKGTSRLAGGPYRHQGLSSVVLIIGLEPITSDVSGRRSHQLSYMSGCGQGRTRTFNHSINSRGLYHWATCPIGGRGGTRTPKSSRKRFYRPPSQPIAQLSLIVHPTGIEPVTCCM